MQVGEVLVEECRNLVAALSARSRRLVAESAAARRSISCRDEECSILKSSANPRLLSVGDLESMVEERAAPMVWSTPSEDGVVRRVGVRLLISSLLFSIRQSVAFLVIELIDIPCNRVQVCRSTRRRRRFRPRLRSSRLFPPGPVQGGSKPLERHAQARWLRKGKPADGLQSRPWRAPSRHASKPQTDL